MLQSQPRLALILTRSLQSSCKREINFSLYGSRARVCQPRQDAKPARNEGKRRKELQKWKHDDVLLQMSFVLRNGRSSCRCVFFTREQPLAPFSSSNCGACPINFKKMTWSSILVALINACLSKVPLYRPTPSQQTQRLSHEPVYRATPRRFASAQGI